MTVTLEKPQLYGSYIIALSGLFELYTRGGHLNHKAKPSGLEHASSIQSSKP